MFFPTALTYFFLSTPPISTAIAAPVANPAVISVIRVVQLVLRFITRPGVTRMARPTARIVGATGTRTTSLSSVSNVLVKATELGLKPRTRTLSALGSGTNRVSRLMPFASSRLGVTRAAHAIAKDALVGKGYEVIAENLSIADVSSNVQIFCNLLMRYRGNTYCTIIRERGAPRLSPQVEAVIRLKTFVGDLSELLSREAPSESKVFFREMCFDGELHVICQHKEP